MSEISITVESGTTKRLLTAGKYCDRDIVVTATGGSGGGGSDLPAGYERVNYIRFNDAQIVDTGVICTQDTKIRVIFTRESSNAMYMYGVVNSGNTASVTAYLSNSGAWRFGNKSISRTIETDDELTQVAIVQKSSIKMIGYTGSLTSVNDFETIGTLLIGSVRNANGSVGAAQFIGKILLFEMWQGEDLALQLIPVIGEAGDYRFFDCVSGVFHDSITDTPLDGGVW